MKTKNLTIQEAIQSGLPFKRETHNCWSQNGSDKYTGYLYSVSREDVLAQDWQIKVPEVTITREKLERSLLATINYAPKSIDAVRLRTYFDAVAKELGL